MKKQSRSEAFTLVEVMVVSGVIAILAAIAIPNLVRAKISANESNAQATLKTISNSLENYAAVNSMYPLTTDPLTGSTPPYLNSDYFTGTHSGYTFTAVLADYYYTVTASPANANTGTTTFTISTGGILSTL